MSHVIKMASNDEAVLKIIYDEDMESPREVYDNLGKMICWHRRYNLGDKHSYSEPRDFLEDLACSNTNLDDGDVEELKNSELMEAIKEHVLILPIYAYEHGAITIRTSSFSDPWDSGQVGWIYISHEDIEKEYGRLDIENAEKNLIGEIATYDQYLRGDVYGFSLETRSGDVIESCWGFYGLDCTESEIRSYIGSDYDDLIDGLEDVR